MLFAQVEKMSKSKLNGVSPDEVLEEFGADALRLYAMFMGPIEKEKLWNTDGVSGCRRFLNRFYDMAQRAQDGTSEEALRLGHRLVQGVTDDLEKMLFNTAISKLMEFVNEMLKLERIPKEVVKMGVQVLAPLAPHMAEELWEQLGEAPSVSEAPWPQADPAYLTADTVTYVVQVNGKVRGRFELPKDQEKEAIVSLAKEDPGIAKHLTGEVRKVIFVPNKLLNFVVA